MRDQMDYLKIFICGPSSAKCKCECGRLEGKCEHQWDGPFVSVEHGESVTCSRCGMDNMSHSMWL